MAAPAAATPSLRAIRQRGDPKRIELTPVGHRIKQKLTIERFQDHLRQGTYCVLEYLFLLVFGEVVEERQTAEVEA